MKNEDGLSSKGGSLRRHAEEQLKSETPNVNPETSELETLRLVQELQLHQIELQMQNEELEAARAELEAGLARYTDLYDFAPIGYVTLKSDGVISQSNLAAARLVGIERAHMVGKRLRQFVSEDTRFTYDTFFRQVFATSDKQSCEVTLMGLTPPLAVTIEAICLGNVHECRVIINDVTERRAMEAALRDSVELFGTLVNSLPMILWMTAPDGKTTFVNQQWSHFTGQPESEALRLGWQHLIHADDAERVGTLFRDAQVERRAFHVEFRRHFVDGLYHFIEARAVPRFTKEGVFLGYLGFSFDITEQKALQAQQFEANKLESLGRLAGGVAHDFNNLLTVILGNVELIEEIQPMDDEVTSLLSNVMQAATRASDLTRQLLSYARRQMVEFTNVDINVLINGLEPLLRSTLGAKYELQITLSNQCTALTNASQIEQVLMNLIVNARDSMPAGGRISLETAVVTLDEA